VGRCRGRIWYARRINRRVGDRAQVAFDGLKTLQREESRGDVVGFFHTHPDGPCHPSERDVRTMRAWCSALGKPLLCVIEGPQGIAAWRFDDDESPGVQTLLVEVFPRGIVIALDAES
jgi:proteasome lid subunit RPN8/RPN11